MKTIPILIIVILSLVQENSCCFDRIRYWFRNMWWRIRHPGGYHGYYPRRNLGPGNIIAISRSDCRYRKKPKIEIFEIRENEVNRGIDIKPLQLQYDLESEESKSEISKLSKMLLSYEKKDAEEKSMKGLQEVGKKKKNPPVVVMMSPGTIKILTPEHEPYQELVPSFLDKTRSQDLVKPGSEVVFNIVPSNGMKEIKKQPKLPAILRIGDLIKERPDAPMSRGRDRPYEYND